MEDFAQEILQHAKAIADTAKAYEVKIEAYIAQGKFLVAIDTAMQFLQLLGIEFPKNQQHQILFWLCKKLKLA